TVVEFVPPPEARTPEAVAALIDGLALQELGASLELTPEAFVAQLSSKQPGLHLALLRNALREARLDLVPALAGGRVEADWPTTLPALEAELDALPPDPRRVAVEAIIAVQPAPQFADVAAWSLIEALLEAPLSPELAMNLLRSAAW